MTNYGRRATDRPGGSVRQRASGGWRGRVRYPGWREQCLQFVTRYLFAIIGMVFFLAPGVPAPLYFPAWLVALWLASHATINTLILLHARRHPFSLRRYRLAMWVDLTTVAMCVANDPYSIPPSLLAFIMVVLGNGMRYGVSLYGEGLVGSFLGAVGGLTLNYLGQGPVSRGVVFLTLLGGIILLYAFILLHRIERARDSLERRSYRDTLTELYNRRAIEDAAATLLEGGAGADHKVAVLFADMDRFKAINDEHGHAEGDRVLRGIAGVLRNAVREGDVVGRYGGDEFVLLLPRADRDAGAAAARRVQEAVRRWTAGEQLGCGVTFGVAMYPDDGRTLEELLTVVDGALYRAKHDGRRGVVERVEVLEPVDPGPAAPE